MPTSALSGHWIIRTAASTEPGRGKEFVVQPHDVLTDGGPEAFVVSLGRSFAAGFADETEVDLTLQPFLRAIACATADDDGFMRQCHIGTQGSDAAFQPLAAGIGGDDDA